MTAGNNGASTPENDDPFAYLYRSEGGDGGANGEANDGAPAQRGGPRTPRTSYNQVTRVGERQYGQQRTQGGGYGYPQPPAGGPGAPAGPGGPGAPASPAGNAHYAAPETLPGGAPRQAAPAAGRPGGRGSGGPNVKGLLIGAIAVVAVVVAGIGVAMMTNSDSDSKPQAGGGGQSAPADNPDDQAKPSGEPAPKPKAELPKADAGSLRIDGGARLEQQIKGAKGTNGSYVTGMNTPGASATWTLDLDTPGRYKLNVTYGVPGKDANLTITVNGKPESRPLSMKNFARAKEGDWEKGWTYSWSLVQLNQGTNTIKLSCEAGNSCDVNLDQVYLTKS
ncbi:carbohydrate-binding protein [Streptomyces sp. URMC 123]|uniref:carbohydrate-binding protein n=1 Tax=Streptomyces sp. URMC 123 TaxID=3423403 RepID=UPI003F1C8F1A